MTWEKRNKFQAHLRALLSIAKRLDARGMVAANDGNLSARVGVDRFLTTRSGSVMARLEPTDILVVDSHGAKIEDKMHPHLPELYRPTSEWDTHAAIYAVRPEINAVVHAHPPYATAWATARVTLPSDVLPEIAVILKHVPLVPFSVPGTLELASAVAKAAIDADAMLLTNHGVITFGTTELEALDRMERVEHAARIMLLSRLLNGPIAMSGAEIAALHAVYPPT